MAALTALAVTAIAATAVGTGVSVYNQNQQAKTAAAVGSYNAQVAQTNAEFNAQQIEQETTYNVARIRETTAWNAKEAERIAELNARTIEQTSDWNARSTMAAADYNYLLSENQAQLADMTGRENIRRMRFEGKKTLSTQQARFAKAGVVAETGTPLEVMAETAGLIELNVLDEKRKADAEATYTRTQGAMNRYLAYKDAEATRFFGAQDAWRTRYEGAMSAYATRKEGAEQAWSTGYFGQQRAYATRYYGAQNAQSQQLYGSTAAAGYRAQAAGTLLSGVANVAGGAATMGAQGLIPGLRPSPGGG